MEKRSLLKNFIKLTLENMNVNPQAPLTLHGPFKVAKSHGRGHHITREFPLVVTPELKASLPWWDESVEREVEENGGVLDGEHEIEIEVDAHVDMGGASFHRGRWRGARASMYEPADEGYVEIQSYIPVSIDGIALGPQDAEHLRAYLGDLTRQEEERISSDERENYMSDAEDAWADSRMDDY